LSDLKSFVFREYNHIKQRKSGLEREALLKLISGYYSSSEDKLRETVDRLIEESEGPDEFMKQLISKLK